MPVIQSRCRHLLRWRARRDDCHSIPVADPLNALFDRWEELVCFRTDDDEEVERLSAMLMEVEQEIAATPAPTAAGLWGKIQVVTHHAEAVGGTLTPSG